MTNPTTQKNRWLGIAQLIVCTAIGAIVWTMLLPLVGELETVKRWIDPLRQRGINPAGMYYTDVFEARDETP